MKIFSWEYSEKNFRVLLVDEFLPSCLGKKKLEGAWSVLANELHFKDEAVAGSDFWGAGSTPLIICEQASDLVRLGVSAPPEFIVERNDFLISSADAHAAIPIERFRRRMAQLVLQDNVTVDEFRSWFVGLLRRLCFQDEHVHGGDRLLSLTRDDDLTIWYPQLENPQADPRREALWLESRFSNNGMRDDELGRYVELLHFIFALPSGNEKRNQITFIDECVQNFVNEKKSAVASSHQKDNVQRSWRAVKDAIKNVLDYWKDKGDIKRLGYYSLTKRVVVLVIDDDAANEIKALKAALNDPASFPSRASIEIFDFERFDELAPKGGALPKQDPNPFSINNIVEAIKKLLASGRSYDAILLDLSFGEKLNSDLTGYHLISRLKQLLPQTPIIIHSQFDDMGHIVRALTTGANWFLKKDPVERKKLARHIQALFRRQEWEKEWKTICASGRPKFCPTDPKKKMWKDFESNFSAKRQYLLYKSLEMFPGRTVRINPMGGGFSTAVTFQAVKVPSRNAPPLQSPLIVKIDTAHNTCLEYERYFRFIRPYIANQSGRIENPERILDEDHSAIVYTFAGRQDAFHELVTMKSLLERDIKNRSSCSYEEYEQAFNIIYDEILPRIHSVNPEIEFDDRSLSGFPNRVFDEIAADDSSGTKDIDAFLANYLCRMPFGRVISNDDICPVPQPLASPSTADVGNGGLVCFEFHAKHISDAGSSIDAYDRKDKTLVSLNGAAIDHVARYRSHVYPSMSLWFEKSKLPNELEFKLDLKLKPTLFDIYKKQVNPQAEEERLEHINWFSDLILNLLREKMVGGLPTFYHVDDHNFQQAINEIENKQDSAFAAVIALFRVVCDLLQSSVCKATLMQVPVGIIHGDLNYANIMLESRKNGSACENDDGKAIYSDAWFIDFARTRRDYITHDFGVAFTSTLALLFDKDVWKNSVSYAHNLSFVVNTSPMKRSASLRDEVSYQNITYLIFRDFVEKAVFGKYDKVPDGVGDDDRYAFVFQMLRRIRRAAIKETVSVEAYGLSVALACMVASRIYLIYEKNAPASAGMIAAAFVCLAHLKQWQWEVENP